MDVQTMDIPHEKDEQFTIEMSGSDVALVQENTMELKWSPVVFGESHCASVQVSKDIIP